MDNLARVYNFPTLEANPSVKLKKDGSIKKIPNNCKREDRFVDPIRNIEDIEKLTHYFQHQIDVARTEAQLKIATRNKAIYIMGINLGLRVSDLVPDKKKLKEGKASGLKWKHIFEDDMQTFHDRRGKKEQKTGKQRQLYFNQKSKDAMVEYIERTHPIITPEGYVFTSSKKNKDGYYDPISDGTIEAMLKKATRACDIKGNYNTHSLRKTFGYQTYIKMMEMNPAMALVTVQRLLNHRSSHETLCYLGLQHDIDKEIIDMLNLG